MLENEFYFVPGTPSVDINKSLSYIRKWDIEGMDNRILDRTKKKVNTKIPKCIKIPRVIKKKLKLHGIYYLGSFQINTNWSNGVVNELLIELNKRYSQYISCRTKSLFE